MAKGVIGHVIEVEDIPKPEITPRVDIFISPTGVFSRKNVAMIKELYLGKILYFLNKRVKQMIELKEPDNVIKNIILDVYTLISNVKVLDSIKEFLDNKNFRKLISDPDFKLYYTVIPFSTISFESLKDAADVLGIPLDEKVYLPILKTWTKKPVPVGMTIIQALEQTAEVYSNVRSIGKYQGLTGQATRGKSREGGQAIGQLDIQCLSTYNTPALLSELLTIRSDDHKSKRAVINSIISTGEASIPRMVGKGGTGNLLRTMITSLGLELSESEDM